LLAAITSNVFLPMLPVEPKTATFFAAADIGHSRGVDVLENSSIRRRPI
jgi:hypothetical protein